MGGTESNLNKLFTQQSIIRRLTEGTVIVNSFVNDVPTVYLAFIVANNGLDMLDETLLQYLFRGGAGRIAIGEPPVRSL